MDSIVKDVVIPAITFVAGFLTKTFVPTGKERFDIGQQRLKNSSDLRMQRDQRYGEFVSALDVMIAAEKDVDLAKRRSAYAGLRKAGDLYFAVLDQIGAYALRGDITSECFRGEHLEELEKSAQKAIPRYYEKMEQIAQLNGFLFTDKLTDSTCRNLRLALKGVLTSVAYGDILKVWQISDPLD